MSTKRWVIAKQRLRDDTAATIVVWIGFAVVVFGLVFLVSRFTNISISAWEIGSQIPRWYLGAMGVYHTAVYLPMYIAHGRTRREFARQSPIALAWLVVLVASLMTAGYALEGAVYRAAGWTQGLSSDGHLFASPDAYGTILAEFLGTFAVWAVAGAALGAAFYRNGFVGLLLLPPAIVTAGLLEASVRPELRELVTRLPVLDRLAAGGASTTSALLVAAACVAVWGITAWLLVRDLPVRPQRA